MKIVFSKKNVNRSSFLDMCQYAYDYGFKGFEIYDAIKERSIHHDSILRRERVADAKRKLLNRNLSIKKFPNIFFAGQISGVEGYMESAASGILAGINAVNYLLDKDPLILPQFSMIGALINYICDEYVSDFQPMGANFGVLPSLETHIRDKRERYGALSERSLNWFDKNL